MPAPILALLALILLTFKLPGMMELFGKVPCPTCTENSLWLPMIGGAYFAALFASMLLYPEWFTKKVSKVGLVWALTLGVSLTLSSQELCYVCLSAHLAHLLAWTSLILFPLTSVKLKAYLVLISPFVAASFFLGLNLTLRLMELSPQEVTLKGGEEVLFVDTPYLKGEEFKKFEETYLFFAGPNCPFCKALYPKLEAISSKLSQNSIRFLALTRMKTEEMTEGLPTFEWVEDPKGELIQALKVQGFPTLIRVNQDGKVTSVTFGNDI